MFFIRTASYCRPSVIFRNITNRHHVKGKAFSLGKNSSGEHPTDGELLLFKLFCGNGGNLDG